MGILVFVILFTLLEIGQGQTKQLSTVCFPVRLSFCPSTSTFTYKCLPPPVQPFVRLSFRLSVCPKPLRRVLFSATWIMAQAIFAKATTLLVTPLNDSVQVLPKVILRLQHWETWRLWCICDVAIKVVLWR